jgi:hypothetical protein
MVLSQLGFLRGVCSSNSKQLMRGGLERGRERGPEMRGEGANRYQEQGERGSLEGAEVRLQPRRDGGTGAV